MGEIIYIVNTLVLIISIVVMIMFYRRKNDREEKTKCEKMLMEVFDLQIRMPELCLVYDSVKVNASIEMIEKYELRKEPFIIYLLSVFDLVVDYYLGKNIFSSKDPIMELAWENTIKSFFRDSSDGRNLYIAHREEFNGRFQKFADEILRNYEH